VHKDLFLNKSFDKKKFPEKVTYFLPAISVYFVFFLCLSDFFLIFYL